jgi:mannose-6-phosphate isomerase-like protein (cupin superfamily)
MVEMNHIFHVSSNGSGATVEQLAPDERLRPESLDSQQDVVLSVFDGVMYVAFDEDEVVLTPGDQVAISAGTARRIWNAGDEVARIGVAVPAASAGRWLQAA